MTHGQVKNLEFAEDGCDACHMSGRRSKFRIFLEGYPYNRENHVRLDSQDESGRPEKERKGRKYNGYSGFWATDEVTDEDSDESADNSLPREFLMGKFCKRRAEVFHSMSHWGEPTVADS